MLLVNRQCRRLFSFYYVKTNLFNAGKMMEIAAKNRVELFLDSGAYSAWSQGQEINIKEYIQFIKDHDEVIDIYANLDVIGDPVATWKNQEVMEKAGLDPLPVFHYGEPVEWLTKYLDKGYEYISLGGMVPISTNMLIRWLDGMFEEFLTDTSGMPIIKVHGFGLTSLVLMLRYPWYSVDSTSWILTGRMGSIFVPQRRNNSWVYDLNPWKIIVSSQSPARKEAGKHINTMTVIEKQILLAYIHEKGFELGKSDFKYVEQSYKPKEEEGEKWALDKPEDKKAKRLLETIIDPGISNRYQLRDEMNIIYFLDLEESMIKWPWAFKHKPTATLF